MCALFSFCGVLDALRGGRAAWETLLAQIGADRMMQPGVEGDWSVKDIIAHVYVNEADSAD